jgi:adenosylcobyric acid synthase
MKPGPRQPTTDDAPRPPAACLAVLGTASDVGKSVVTTALCRLFARRGLRVAPFKAQNMSNNSGVTPEGLEIGRAQIAQAEAARIAPHVDMNPILLKPTSDVGAQVVLLGRAVGNAAAVDYHRDKARLFALAQAALERLRGRSDLVILEGAGSCAEVNLMAHDLVNLPMAAAAAAPVLLVADIHRGGVFAQVVGTLACLPPEQAARIAGVIINRFRGDPDLFREGVAWLEARTGKPVFGVLPWFSDFAIAAEDSVVIENPQPPAAGDANAPAVAVIRLPHIANFTDIAPLTEVAGLRVAFIERVQSLSPFQAVIVPGSKNTRADLEWLHTTGWTARLTAHVQRGGHLLGICGGYQMLGREVQDPDGLEGAPGVSAGLDLLPVVTVLKAPKFTTVTHFAWEGIEGGGYEIHMGHSRLVAAAVAPFEVLARNGSACRERDGCSALAGRVLGTYLHGLFDTPAITARWLAGIGLPGLTPPAHGGLAGRERAYDMLAEHFQRHVDLEAIAALLQRPVGRRS